MYVRWMGAFRHNGSLAEALNYEFSRETDVACEQLQKGKSEVARTARIGLLVDPSAVYRRFSGDVWSEYDVTGRLYATRKPYDAKFSHHKESWAHPVYTGIVIRNGSFSTLSFEARAQIAKFVSLHQDVPVYKLVKGKLVREKINI